VILACRTVDSEHGADEAEQTRSTSTMRPSSSRTTATRLSRLVVAYLRYLRGCDKQSSIVCRHCGLTIWTRTTTGDILCDVIILWRNLTSDELDRDDLSKSTTQCRRGTISKATCTKPH